MAIGQGSTFKVAYAPTQIIYDAIQNPDTSTLYFVGDTQNIILDGIRYGFNQAEDAPFATQAEAEAGLLADVYMSPQRVANYVANLAGAVNGLATLDATGVVPASQLPSYVDDIVEYTDTLDIQRVVDTATLSHTSGSQVNTISGSLNEYIYNYNNGAVYQCTNAASPDFTWTYIASPTGFPDGGFEQGKIYVNKSTNKQYRAVSATPQETSLAFIGSGLALGETQFTAYRGDRGKIAYDHSQVTGNPHGLTLSTFGISASAAEINALDGFTGDYLDLNYAESLRATGVTSTEFDYLDGVTSNIQTQLNDKVGIDGDDMYGNLAFHYLGIANNTSSLGITFHYRDTADKSKFLNVTYTGVLTFDNNAIWHAGNFTPSTKLNTTGGTLTGDLTLDKDGTTDVGSHGVVFKGNILTSDFTKELNMNANGELLFAGNQIWDEGNLDPNDYLAVSGDTMNGALIMNQGFTGTTDKDSLPITFSYKEASVDKTLNLLVDQDGNLKIGSGVIYHTNNKPTPGAIGALAIIGGTLTGDLTMQKDGTTDVGSHGIIFQGNILASDFTKELNMTSGGVLQFAGNDVYYEGNEPVTWTVLS
jgi:hypothetical protein